MTKTISESYIERIETAIRGIRLGTKKPVDVAGIVSTNLDKLRPLNEGMAIELTNKYGSAVVDYKHKLAAKK